MMEKNSKKYQLVAWTRNSMSDNPELRIIPSLHFDLQEPFFKEIAACHHAEEKGIDVTRRLVNAYERNARFFFLTGHNGDGARFLCLAATYCVIDDFWTDWDTDLGRYMVHYGPMNGDFFRLYKEFNDAVAKYHREDILLEENSIRLASLYRQITEEERDLEHHLDEVRRWK